VVLLYTASMSTCPIYLALGWRTNKNK